MKRREDAIILGVGTTRRKFRVTNNNPKDIVIKIPAFRYIANASGKLCKGTGNHKCLFNKGDKLEILCPETVKEESQATFFIHRSWNGKDMLMQRNFYHYAPLLDFIEECVLEFSVTKIGHYSIGYYEECVCVQPVPGMDLWIDIRLTLRDYQKKEEIQAKEREIENERRMIQNLLIDNAIELGDEGIDEPWGYGYSYHDSPYDGYD